jgi:hypothetical protein
MTAVSTGSCVRGVAAASSVVNVRKVEMIHKVWACTSIGSCVASFVLSALPYLQVIAVLLSIAAAIKALRSKS